jgi:sirohydrochlorin ferrochelatase
LVYEPHDGLLRKSEQLLAGAAKTYEAKGVNHFQEQFWEYAPIGNAFQDLFNGGAGAAFVVPK